VLSAAEVPAVALATQLESLQENDEM
jgi:hypothetical protein